MKTIARNDPANPVLNRRAFTLVELLVVIAIIAVLAGLLFPVGGVVKRNALFKRTQAEMAQLETAIDSYKAAYGFYPPNNSNNSYLVNQLYYELGGTRLTNNGKLYITLDGSAQITTNDVPVAFPGVSGFINCTKPGAGEDVPFAKDFLSDLKPNQITKNFTNNNVQVVLLLGSVGGPDQNYRPLNAVDVNPWRYVSPGVNNPNGYDLYIQLVMKPGQTNLICNWSKQVQVNSPLP